MGAADAYLQGGALLVLIGFASIVIRTLYLDNKELREHVDALTEASRALLTKYLGHSRWCHFRRPMMPETCVWLRPNSCPSSRCVHPPAAYRLRISRTWSSVTLASA